MKYTPYPYQTACTNHILQHPYSALFVDMGMGKSVSTLTAIDILINQELEVEKVLVIAPLRVAEDTWTGEVAKWDHLKHLTVSKVLGSEAQRKAALQAKADIYVINRENVPWLVALYGTAFPFDMLVIDELSSFKSSKAQRFKALRQIRPLIRRVVGLTGTPAPNGLIDLWPQLYLLDMGERLGKSITQYRSTYFNPGRSNGHVVFNYKLKNGSEDQIHDKIRDICISMKSEDYLNLPKQIDNDVAVHLSTETLRQYKEFERDQVLALANQEEISVANAAALSNKLLQYSNGAVYNEAGEALSVHTEKLDALGELLEEANGKPVLVFYSFRHDVVRIKNYLKAFKPVELKTSDDIAAWNRKEIQTMIAHPASAGHGLNLQFGGNLIAWFGLTWSLELFQQANKRLHRPGQTEIVINNRLLCTDTMDEDVIKALANKATGQNALLEAVKARIEQYSRRFLKAG